MIASSLRSYGPFGPMVSKKIATSLSVSHFITVITHPPPPVIALFRDFRDFRDFCDRRVGVGNPIFLKSVEQIIVKILDNRGSNVVYLQRERERVARVVKSREGREKSGRLSCTEKS